MRFKELQLDFEALLSQAVSTNGLLNYWLWHQAPDPSTYSLESIAAAQLAYFECMLEAFPKDVKRILDVGSGTGSNALALSKRGYQVDCVCPSPHLNLLARAKLPAGSTVHECKYEAFECKDDQYDFIFFAESFHYIDPQTALNQVAAQSRFGGLIFDYFPKAPTAGRITHAQFEAHVKATEKLQIKESLDLTAKIVPTFDALHGLRNMQLAPFLLRLSQSLRSHYPVLAYLPAALLERKAKRWLTKPSKRVSFERDFEYRLITLERRP
jgi:SAM-dependent methyltransferase